MIKNFAGLGISFFPVDKGAQKAVDEMADSLEEVNEEIETVADEGPKAFERLAASITESANATKEKASSMIKSVEALKGEMNLSSDLESTYLQASVSARKLAAQTGVSSSEIQKQTSFFHDLNMLA